MEVVIRDIDGGLKDTFQDLNSVLKIKTFQYQKPILEWEDIKIMCCLDIDDMGLKAEQILSLLNLIKPAPSFAWISHSGNGVHLIYIAQEPYQANELAALAILWILQRHPEIEIYELLTHTFFPPGDILQFKEAVDLTTINSVLESNVNVSTEEIERYLSNKNMRIGERYPHLFCPIDSERIAGRNPVRVLAEGIYCHACQARSGRGFVSFNQLIDTPETKQHSVLFNLIKHKVHWDHAKYILTQIFELNEGLIKLIYQASLVFKHGPEIRKTAVMFPDRNFIRLGSWWATETGEYYNKDVTGMLVALPVCQYLSSEGKQKIDSSILTKLKQTINIEDVGYYGLQPIRGIKIYGHSIPYGTRDFRIILQNHILTRNEYAKFRARYVRTEPSNYELAFRHINEIFPGVSRNLIRLLIAARGVSEGQIGLPPFIFISGPSRAAKTSTVLVVAAIIGDWATSILWTNNMERVRQSMLEAKDKGTFAVFNEINKQSIKEKVSPKQALDDCLNLTPDSISHKLWVGPVPLGNLPVCVWTDTEVPYEAKESTQLARRIVHVQLTDPVDWDKTIINSGLHQIERLRVLNQETAEACNILVSEVIDTFFKEPRDLKSIAKELGFLTLEDEQDEGRTDILMEFFNSVNTSESTPQNVDARRWTGRGWKLLQIGEDTPLGQLWGVLCDGDNPKTSRKLTEANWKKITGRAAPIEFQCQAHGNKVVVRFYSKQGLNRGEYAVNHEIT